MIKPVSSTINNVSMKKQSFGATVVTKDCFDNLSKESQAKVKQLVENLNLFFPMNDIYIDKTHSRDSFSYKVQKSNPVAIFAHPEIFPYVSQYFETPEEMVTYMKTVFLMDIAHKKMYGIKEPVISKEIKNVSEKKAGTILSTMMAEIRKFNKEQKDKNLDS